MRKGMFITNSKEAKTLKQRLVQIIEHSQELKFLVGFFYFSGWQEIYDALKSRDDLNIKILVGLQVDRILGRSIEIPEKSSGQSAEDKAEVFFESLKKALNCNDTDIKEMYEQVDLFIELIEEKRLHIRKTMDPNHAKLYIFKIKDALKGILDAKFITGSSNLTKAGILEQNEFNVEISDYGVSEAEEYFDALWNTAVEITENDQRRKDMLSLIRRKTQFADITPFEAYTAVLKTYIETQEQKKIKPGILRILEEEGYRDYTYQLDAVNQALNIIETYNGVIVADVVGLGKSIIACMIAKNIGRRGLVICPPGLIGDRQTASSGWLKYINDFKLYDWEVRSSGDLENIIEYMKNNGEDIEIVIVDEAHSFRNQDTERYHHLSLICKNRQVILLTATPFNNSPEDIFSMLKLFIVPGKSRITLDDDLEMRFSYYNSLFKKLAYISKNYNSANPEKRKKLEKYYKDIFDESNVNLDNVNNRAKQLAREIRSVLEPVLIRRNRIDLKNDPVYKNEIDQLSEIEDPKELFYELSKEQSEFYDKVIYEYFGDEGLFKGAIYQPFMYEKTRDEDSLNEEENRAFQQQRNLFDFMRRLLVKRFESSFGAFNQSINNFIRIHDIILDFIKNSGYKYILDRKLIEKIYTYDIEEIDSAIEEFMIKLKEKRIPRHEKKYDINKFKEKEKFLNDIEYDRKLFIKIQSRITELDLVKSDPKIIKLIKKIKEIITKKEKPVRKVIVFTEYVDTVKHLKTFLENSFGEKVFAVPGYLSSSGYNILLKNFDASIDKSEQLDNYSILLTSDKLSEGVNLNRAGVVINYDIPWNPTRVIQRVGRINRIGMKVFDKLQIYNFFPTEQGADVVKSRQIAAQKMYLIHNTLGEDAKIFNSKEIPEASGLYNRININPDKLEDESSLTNIRREYYKIKEKYPEVIAAISEMPLRLKTAKSYSMNQLTVYRRKGLAFFVHHIGYGEKRNDNVKSLSFEESLKYIKCDKLEPKVKRSPRFWEYYDTIKKFKEILKMPRNENTLEIKALNNLMTALRFHKEKLEPYIQFIRNLIKDMREYRTLSRFTLRHLISVDLNPDIKPDITKFIKEIKIIYNTLGEDYLDIVKNRAGSTNSEIIISIENIVKED